MKTENQELTEDQKDELINKDFNNLIKQMRLAFSLFFVTAIINGVALKAMWFWFITTPFNLPKINLALSIGLIVLIKYSFTISFKKFKNKADTDPLTVDYVLNKYKESIFNFLFVITISYILHFFI